MDIDINDFFIEIPQIQFDPADFFDLIEESEFKEYRGYEGDGFPLITCSDDEMRSSDVVQHYANVFKDFDLRQSNYVSTQVSPGVERAHEYDPTETKLFGTLIKGDMSEKIITPHIDATRTAAIVFPLSFPQHVNLLEEKGSTSPYYVHEYNPVVTIIHAGKHWHSVSVTPYIKYQFQFDCYNSWDEIVDLVNQFS